MKALALLLGVFLAPACCDAALDALDALPACDSGLASTYVVNCGNGSGICRGASGQIRFAGCLLSEGTEADPSVIRCVEVCQ